MAWRNSTDTQDRIFAALVYIIPIYYSFSFGSSLIIRFLSRSPILIGLFDIFLTPWKIVNSLPFGNLILFFVLFLAVVRNDRVSRFVRFNTMQALLLCIFLILLEIGLQVLRLGLIAPVLNPIIFTIILAVCIYSIIKAAQGNYPDIPGISEAVNGQIF